MINKPNLFSNNEVAKWFFRLNIPNELLAYQYLKFIKNEKDLNEIERISCLHKLEFFFF